jgi:SAM-dependent methyltransferase
MVATELERSTDAFMEQVFGDLIGSLNVAMASIGDRLGLFRDLSQNGPAMASELAKRTGVSLRYAQEWLNAMACSGYLIYDPDGAVFSLPAEHAPVIAEENGPAFLGGPLQIAPLMIGLVPRIAEVFRTGGGLPQSAYDPGVWEGMERETAPIFENFLIEGWLGAAPDVGIKLEAGAHVADVGCGSGRAVLRMAQAYPNATFVGYDAFPAQIERATANAKAAGLEDRVTFAVRDVSKGLPEKYDVITTFDVVHDAVDPAGLLRAIRQGLRPGGLYLIQEFAAGERLEDNIGPVGSFLYGVSVLYCMTTSLAHGGAGLGTAGMPESVVTAMGAEAGFASTERLTIDDPFHALYLLRS